VLFCALLVLLSILQHGKEQILMGLDCVRLWEVWGGQCREGKRTVAHAHARQILLLLKQAGARVGVQHSQVQGASPTPLCGGAIDVTRHVEFPDAKLVPHVDIPVPSCPTCTRGS